MGYLVFFGFTDQGVYSFSAFSVFFCFFFVFVIVFGGFDCLYWLLIVFVLFMFFLNCCLMVCYFLFLSIIYIYIEAFDPFPVVQTFI